MYSLFGIAHVIVSLVLIVIVLMQSQQSMNLSGMFGGASQSALGSKPQSVLSKATTVLAIVFIGSSLLFTLWPRSNDGALSPSSVEGQGSPPAQNQQAPQQSPPSQNNNPGASNQGNQPPQQPSGSN